MAGTSTPKIHERRIRKGRSNSRELQPTRDAGGFDARYAPAYYEDADYCARLWAHGYSVRYEPRAVAVHHEFGSATSKYFREEIQAPWFAYYLKGRGEMTLPEALTFEAGTNRWRSWEAWPPTNRTKTRNLYFGLNRTLSSVQG